MNPYSIAGWISRIENKECRDYYLHSPNYDSLKDKVCETFMEVFFDNNFYDKNTNDYSKEGSFYWKLKRGQIYISNPHTLTGDVRFIETARVIYIPSGKTGTFLNDSRSGKIGTFLNDSCGRQFIKWGDTIDYTSASDLKNLEWYFGKKNEKQAYQVGAKVVRNNQTWQYGNEDIHNDKPCVGTVLETIDGHFICVKWENGKKRGYNQIYLLLYNDENTTTDTTTDTNKVDKLIGKTVIVSNVLPTIVDGKVPTGGVLKPKIKKAIVQNGNLLFREVIV